MGGFTEKEKSKRRSGLDYRTSVSSQGSSFSLGSEFWEDSPFPTQAGAEVMGIGSC